MGLQSPVLLGRDHFLLRHRDCVEEGFHRSSGEAPAALMRARLIGYLIIGAHNVMAWQNLLLTPLKLIVAPPLDFLFPAKDKGEAQQLSWYSRRRE